MKPSAPRVLSGLANPLEWLYLWVGGALIWKYFFLYDDAFVYFRYVDNLLFQRIGLVYNQGEYVEGFSSALWTLLLIPLRATGIDWTTLLLGLAWAGWCAIWWMMVRLGSWLVPGVELRARTNLPLAFLCTSYAFLSWSTSGLETLPLQVGAVVCALFVVRPDKRWLQIGVALLPLVRHELLPSLVLAALWARWRNGRTPWLLLVSAALSLGAWELFRMGYYAELLPNTFFLKDANDWAQGWTYVRDTFSTYRLPWLAGSLIVLLGLAVRRGASSQWAPRLAMLLIALPVVLYVARIGGAPIHYRYLAFPFTLVLCTASGIFEDWMRVSIPKRGKWIAPAVGISVALASATLFPPQLDRHPLRSDVKVEYVDKILEAEFHRQKGRSEWNDWERVVDSETLTTWRREHPDSRYAKVDLATWCINAYVAYSSRIVHGFGLTDAILARARVPATRPGHKPRLVEMARHMVAVHEAEGPPGPGMYRRAVESGVAPPWVAKNLDLIEEIELKVFGTGSFWRNVALALRWTGRFSP